MPGDVNYYLKKATKKDKHLIILQYKYRGLKFVYSVGESVEKKHWNESKQRVKSNTTTTKDGQYSLNDLLDKLEEVLLSTYRKELVNGIPARTKLKEALDNFLYQNHDAPEKPSFFKLMDQFIKGVIKNREGEDKSYHTTKVYLTVKNHLLEFERQTKYPVDFATVTLDFYRKYINYLSEKKLAQNTKAKHIQVIKAVMNEAFDLKYTANVDYRHKKFKAAWQESDAVYLTDQEIMKLYRHDLSANKRLEQVRDLFVFGCYVGLRYSDSSTVKPGNIIATHSENGATEYYIKMLTGKTKELVVIPCNPVVLEIFEKYKASPNKLPRPLSNQKFNDYIKEACREAKLTEKGRLATEPELELCDCISSHTGRRSFATNLYLEGFPIIDLMRVTGHRTEKSFMKYIRHTKLDTAKRLNEHIKKSWEKKILRIA